MNSFKTMFQMFLYRGIGNMWRDSSEYCLLSVLVLMFCESVSSEYYANISELLPMDSYGRAHRPDKTTHEPSEAILNDEASGSRFPKLFSFHALDEDLLVDLEFAIPFIQVPIKKSMDMSNQAFRSLVNLNTPAIVVSGLFIVVGAGFGLLFNSFVGKTTGVKRKSRISDVSSLLDPFKLIQKGVNGERSETGISDLIEIIEGKFRENNVDVTACVQKSICSFVKKSADRVRNGRGSGTNKIIDGLASSEWLLQYLEGTAVRDAIDAGNSITNCGYKYPSCKWSSPEKHMMDFVLGFIDF